MSTVKVIADWLVTNLRATVEQGENELLATFRLKQGRSQAVQITFSDSRYKNAYRVEIKSRCCVADNAAFVRHALKRNLNTPLGGFALGKTNDARTIDFYHRILIPSDSVLDQHEILSAAIAVATQADSIERLNEKEDLF